MSCSHNDCLVLVSTMNNKSIAMLFSICYIILYLYIHGYILGRLDKDSTGLIILTSDGRVNNALLSPTVRKDKVCGRI